MNMINMSQNVRLNQRQQQTFLTLSLKPEQEKKPTMQYFVPSNYLDNFS